MHALRHFQDVAPRRVVRVHAVAVGQPHHPIGGKRAEVPKDGTGVHRGELVCVAQQHEARVRPERAQQPVHHHGVDHGGLVHHDHARAERAALVRAIASAARRVPEQAVQRLAVRRRPEERRVVEGGRPQGTQRAGHRGAHAVGRLARGGGERNVGLGVVAQPHQHAQQAHHDAGLARPGATGDERQTGLRRHAHRPLLLAREPHGALPCEGRGREDIAQGAL
jgi:hypothetical protein